ncbi:glycerophosphodiester phosphodiesterase family protein [Salicibibacter kimchii]|uniref:GP-PDE domain-containing protein n=1 Tax=Salicibibacter kimchii TaxID=2099786 RepID=A0A345BX50_9BACI|nr:glycerophosphodiester phosphodiesterase family protein [Salicibibacter kimchii]AXF55531.1 hypothetical protein DT065_05520 [Salicibibacter kimchii]
MNWIAHRGYSREAPENTFAAFRRAIEKGASGIELDVHVSKDGELVVMHDDDVSRTTNGKGLVRDMTASELKRLDAGSWFGEPYRGEEVPFLEEVLHFVPPEVLINIEIKNIPIFYEGIEKKVSDAFIRQNCMEQATFRRSIIAVYID